MKSRIMIYVAMAFLLMSVAMAQTYDYCVSGTQFGDYTRSPPENQSFDTLFTSYAQYSNTQTATQKFEIGDFLPDNAGYEAMYVFKTELKFLNVTDTSNFNQPYIASFSFAGTQLEGYQVFDYDGDGDDELAIINTTTTLSSLMVLNFTLSGVEKVFENRLIHEAYNKYPTCFDGWCYVVDDESIFHKLSLTTIGENYTSAIGNYDDGANNYLGYATIDYCDDLTGRDVVVAGQFDASANGVKVVMVDPDTLVTKATYQSSACRSLREDIISPPICDVLDDGNVHIFVGGEGHSSDSNTHQSNYLILSENMTINDGGCVGSATSSCPANPPPHFHIGGFYDVDDDGVNELHVWRRFQYGTGGGGGGLCPTPSDTLFNFNGTDFVQLIAEGEIPSFVSSSSTFYNLSLRMYFFDWDGDGIKDFIAPNNKVYNLTGDYVDDWMDSLAQEYVQTAVLQTNNSNADIFWVWGGLQVNSDGLSTETCNFAEYNYTEPTYNGTPPNVTGITNITSFFTWDYIVDFGGEAWYDIITDGLDNETFIGLDCNDDGNLEHSLSLRGENNATLNCTYTVSGSVTARAYVTDITNQNTTNVTDTELNYVLPPDTANCVGFVAPLCTGSCWFFDDFSYTNYSIKCNGWQTAEIIVDNFELDIQGLELGEQLYVNKVNDPIRKSEYAGFSMQFTFDQRSDTRVNLIIYDKDVSKRVLNMYWENGAIYATDDVFPYENLIGTYTEGVPTNIFVSFNFNENEAFFVYGGDSVTTELAESDVTSAGYVSFVPISNSNFNMTITDFYIQVGADQTENFTSDPLDNLTEKLTYLDTGNFCAINWSNNDFLQDECVTRGYNDSAIGLNFCLIGSCVGDTFTWAYTRAQLNIYKTLVMILFFLLLAPLLVALMRRR